MDHVPGEGHADWSDAAVAMDRGLRAFAEAVRPVLSASGFDAIGIANVLFLLAIGTAPRNLTELIRDGRYLGSNASYALRTLQGSGLVERKADERDRRSAIISLTPAGAALAAAVRAAVPGGGAAAAEAARIIAGFEQACTRKG